MAKSGLPPRFKPFTGMVAPAAKRLQQQRFQGSAHERGYTSKWTRLAIAYRKKHPFCEWCDQEDRFTLADLVDHMIPVVDDPELILEWSNLWSLCRHCHGRKFSMELHARKNGLIEMLPIWCREVEKRPAQFRSPNAVSR